MMQKYFDRTNHFMELFNSDTGFYLRTGVLVRDKESGKVKDSGIDPFMRNFPALLDVGIMGHCIHGQSGLCAKSGVQCYQDGQHNVQPNMSLADFESILKQCEGKCFQFALGGRGDVDQYEHFEELLKLCKKYQIVPNFTSSGLGFTEEIVTLCKEYCGAVAVSEYFSEYTNRAVKMLVDSGVKTNIHFVLGNNTIDRAIHMLENKEFPVGINAVIFLLHKPVGMGQSSNVLQYSDERVKHFFELIDTQKFDFKIGFDSCNVPALLNLTKNINKSSFDTCEGGRYSAYITSDMKMLPCSFDNQEEHWAVDLRKNTVQQAWDSEQFDNFRGHFKTSCKGCQNRCECYGGCPIRREIVLCDKKEKDLQ